MKQFKKVLSVLTVLALVVMAMPARAKAAGTVVDFEDGIIPDGIVVHYNDTTGEVDGDAFLMSVVDFQGSKMLKIDTQSGVDMAKVRFQVDVLVGADNVTNVGGISYDVAIENPSGEAAGWNGGAIGAGNWAAANGWSNGTEFVLEEYTNAATAVTNFKAMILEGFGFTGEQAPLFLFMNWGPATNDIYIDNVVIYDKAGAPMDILTLGAEDAAADEAADDGAAATDVPKTGVVGLGIVYGLGALATGAVALKRRNK